MYLRMIVIIAYYVSDPYVILSVRTDRTAHRQRMSNSRVLWPGDWLDGWVELLWKDDGRNGFK